MKRTELTRRTPLRRTTPLRGSALSHGGRRRKPMKRSGPKPIPANVRDQVRVRSGGQCEWVERIGHGESWRCPLAAAHMHHIEPKGMGGTSQPDMPDGLVHLCSPHHDRAHNDRAASEALGYIKRRNR